MRTRLAHRQPSTTSPDGAGGHSALSFQQMVPLLQKRGLQLVELPAGKFELTAYSGPLVRDSYWRWPERNLAGNAIDFFMRVLDLSFHDAMRQITGP